MSNTVVFITDPTTPDSWERVAVPEDGSVGVTIRARFAAWLPSMHVYHESVSVDNDVTPRGEKGLERLQALSGTFYVVCYPNGPLALPFFKFVFLAVLSIIVAPSTPKIPAPVFRGRNNLATSPNNDLSSRSNSPRINGRIPDIFGTVRSTPDLIAAPYSIFENNREVEYAYMCIGRGAYTVSDIKDGETSVSLIQGCSVAVYGPYTSPNSAESGSPVSGAEFSIGAPITHKVLNTRRNNSVNGQVLRPPNQQSLSAQIRFIYPNVIQILPDSTPDFSKAFVDGDTVTLTGATLTAGGASTVLETFSSGVAYAFNPDEGINLGLIIILVMNGSGSSTGIFSPNYVAGATIELNDISATVNNAGYEQTLDLSGSYEIHSVSIGQLSDEYTIPQVFIGLVSPELVNANWSLISGLGIEQPISKLFELTIANPALDFDLDGTYSVVSVTSKEMVVAVLGSPIADWSNLQTVSASPYLGVTVQNAEALKWYGPFILEADARTSILANFIAANGLYTDNGTTQTAVSVVVQLEVTPVDSDNVATGAPQYFQLTLNGSASLKETVASTMVAATSFIGRCSVRANRLTPADTSFVGTVVDEVRWRDLYSVSPVSQTHFGNVTTVHSVTFATASALAVKDRRLNMLVTRKIPRRIFGSPSDHIQFTNELYDSNSADEIICAMARDRYIGNYRLAELDVDAIYDTIADVRSYFGTDKAKEFCYTFDNDNLSFEESVQLVARAVFCTAYRSGSQLRLSFEKLTDNSTLLFNHRNKIPRSETRDVQFGGSFDNDGIEYVYVDPTDDAVISLFLPENTALVSPERIESIGVRNHLQAFFHAWRIWNKKVYRNTVVQFDALQEAQLLNINERILVADNVRADVQDGEVTAVNGLELTLSQNVDLTDYSSYVIFLQHTDGILESITVTSGSAANKVVLGQAPRLSLVTDPALGVPTTYLITGDTELQQTAFLVSERSPAKKMVSTVTAINYDPRYYDHDDCYVGSPTCVTDDGYGRTGGYIIDTDSEYLELPTAPILSVDGTGLSWTASVAGSWPLSKYIVFSADSGAQLTSVSGLTLGYDLAVLDLAYGTYNVYVQAVDNHGNASNPSNVVQVIIEPPPSFPGYAVTFVTGTNGVQDDGYYANGTYGSMVNDGVLNALGDMHTNSVVAGDDSGPIVFVVLQRTASQPGPSALSEVHFVGENGTISLGPADLRETFTSGPTARWWVYDVASYNHFTVGQQYTVYLVASLA